jgi:hypothetical protein
MQTLGAFTGLVLISNVVIFVALALFRRERPDLRTRLFSWAVHGGARRRSTSARHSGIPAS